MVRFPRFNKFTGAVALLLALGISPLSQGQEVFPKLPPVPNLSSSDSWSNSTPGTWSYKIYSLEKWGASPEVGAWLAETIPQMIAPGTWNSDSTKGKLSYYAPGRVLVVSHSPGVQAQVEAFLSQVKEAMPNASKAQPNSSGVVPASFSVVPRVMKMVSGQSTNPKMPPLPPSMHRPSMGERPKHRFQFSVTYEGDGLIDDNVVEMIKAQAGVPSSSTPVGQSACASGVCVSPVAVYQPGSSVLPQPMVKPPSVGVPQYGLPRSTAPVPPSMPTAN